MQARALSRVELAGFDTIEEVGELTKLGVKLGLQVAIGTRDDDQLGITFTASDAVMGEGGASLVHELARLVAIECYARDEAVDAVLASVKRRLKEIHFTSRRPSDSRGIGAGHADDE